MTRKITSLNTNTQNIDVIATKLLCKFNPMTYFFTVGMVSRMFPIISKQFKVFNSVIKFVAINMVDNFHSGKESSKFLFHYKSLFGNPHIFSGKRVMGLPNRIISPSIYASTPKVMVSNCIRTFSGTKKLFQMFISSELFSTTKAWGIGISKVGFTFSGTKDSFSVAGVIFEMFMAVTTSVGNHSSLLYQRDLAE